MRSVLKIGIIVPEMILRLPVFCFSFGPETPKKQFITFSPVVHHCVRCMVSRVKPGLKKI